MASATTGEAGGGAGAGPGGGRGGCEAPEHGPPPRASSRPRSILGALRTGAGVRASALDAAAEALAASRLAPASSPEGSGRGGGGVGSPGPSPSLYAHVLSTRCAAAAAAARGARLPRLPTRERPHRKPAVRSVARSSCHERAAPSRHHCMPTER